MKLIFVKEPPSALCLAYVKGMIAENLPEERVNMLLEKGICEVVKDEAAEKAAAGKAKK